MVTVLRMIPWWAPPIVGVGALGLVLLWSRKASAAASLPGAALLPGASTLDPSKVKLTYGSSARKLSASVEGYLRTAAAMAGTPDVMVTSTFRTSADQARIMLDMVKARGASYARDLYSGAGEQVVNLLDGLLKAQSATRMSDTTIRGQGQKMIDDLTARGQIVSRHLENPEFVAVDISPRVLTGISTLTTTQAGSEPAVLALTAALRALPETRKVIPPPDDPAIHVEFKVPAGGAVGWLGGRLGYGNMAPGPHGDGGDCCRGSWELAVTQEYRASPGHYEPMNEGWYGAPTDRGECGSHSWEQACNPSPGGEECKPGIGCCI